MSKIILRFDPPEGWTMTEKNKVFDVHCPNGHEGEIGSTYGVPVNVCCNTCGVTRSMIINDESEYEDQR